MKIEEVSIDTLKPYAKNAKKHPDYQVEHIANSLKEFGWQQPIVIDQNGVVIIGHGRLLAAKKLGMQTVPVTRAEGLTPAQVKALRLADNQVNAESGYDMNMLKLELDDLKVDFDMEDFGFDLDDLAEDEEEDDRDPSCQHNVFENQERMQFSSDNYYGIPNMQATQTTGTQMLRFCDWKEINDPENYIAHFYYDDYKFISAWREPDKYIDRLKRFKAVISPDFSLYTDFPRSLQILSCYRRQWCGCYWQMLGLDVIPDVVWGDEESFTYCFEGIPEGGTVAVSTVGVKNDDEWNNKDGELFKAGYNEMMKRLHPSTVLFYGAMIDGLEGNIIRIPSYYELKRVKMSEGKNGKR